MTQVRTALSRAALATGALLAALLVIGFSYERLMAERDARDFPPPGRILPVEGRPMHLNCTGTGNPTVIMDAGLGGWSMDWSEVQPSVARSTRVCTYDRPGMGWSAPRADPRDAQHAVSELRLLLAAAEIDGPLLLVGHSNGGLRMLLFAAEQRADVGGVVLVDPTPISTDAELFASLSPAEQSQLLSLSSAQPTQPREGSQPLMGLIQAAQQFGVARLFSESLLSSSIYPHLSHELQPAYRAGINRSSYFSTLAAEAEQRQASIDQVRSMSALGDVPLVVLASSHEAAFYVDPVPTELSGRVSDLMHVMLDTSRQAIAHLSSRGRVETVARSGHYIQFDRPDAVLEAVDAVLVARR
jgi:pimeloyl-ACP methyl ester carboxylesterase